MELQLFVVALASDGLMSRNFYLDSLNGNSVGGGVEATKVRGRLSVNRIHTLG